MSSSAPEAAPGREPISQESRDRGYDDVRLLEVGKMPRRVDRKERRPGHHGEERSAVLERRHAVLSSPHDQHGPGVCAQCSELLGLVGGRGSGRPVLKTGSK